MIPSTSAGKLKHELKKYIYLKKKKKKMCTTLLSV